VDPKTPHIKFVLEVIEAFLNDILLSVDSQSIQRVFELCAEQGANTDRLAPSLVQRFFVQQNLVIDLTGI